MGTDINRDAVWFKSGNVDRVKRNDSMAPYELGKEYYIAMTFNDNGDGSTTVHWQKRNAATGMLEKEDSAVVPNWRLSDVTSSTATFSIGVWKTNAAKDACASYNEVRVWNGVLSEDQLAANASMGPDHYVPSYVTGFGLDAGTTFNVPETGFTATGTVRLGSGSKLRFDTANFTAETVQFQAPNYEIPSGSLIDYVELTDATTYTATVSGTTITVTRNP